MRREPEALLPPDALVLKPWPPRALGQRCWLSALSCAGPTLCSASKPHDEEDADGQQGACEPERDECRAPVRAVAHRVEDPDADAPRVERADDRGDASKAERAESC